MLEFSRDATVMAKKGEEKCNISNKLDYLNYQYFEHDTSSKQYNENKKLEQMRLIRMVMNNELTAKQRECVSLVLADGMKQKDAAKALGVSNSTVCRHLKAARKKINAALAYYECGEYGTRKTFD